MNEKDYAEANAFVAWLVDLITKIREFLASIGISFGTEE